MIKMNNTYIIIYIITVVVIIVFLAVAAMCYKNGKNAKTQDNLRLKAINDDERGRTFGGRKKIKLRK